MFLSRVFLAATVALAVPLVIPFGTVAAWAETTAPATDPSAEGATDTAASIPALTQALQLDALFAVLRDEGLAFGQSLETDMFPGGGGPKWEATVSAIYDVPGLRSRFDAVLQDTLANDPEALDEIIAFFTSDLGQRVVELEVAARKAFLDETVEEAARVAADKRFSDRDPKLPLLRRFIEAGDLIEMNVAGALSGNLAFLTGMSEAGAYGQALPQDQLMSDTWAQEDQIRDDTTSWLYAYLGLAYEPLTEAELEAYVDFMDSPAGRRLNAALFTAFDHVFQQVSNQLGHAAGVAMQSSDI